MQCFLDNRDTNDGDVINYNKTLTVTLTEQTPLLFAVGAIDEDLPVGIQSRGYAYKLEFPSAYRVEGDRDLTGQECQTDPNPCFTAKVHVHVVSSNVPTAQALAAQLAVSTSTGAQAAGLPTLNQQAAPATAANDEFSALFQ